MATDEGENIRKKRRNEDTTYFKAPPFSIRVDQRQKYVCPVMAL